MHENEQHITNVDFGRSKVADENTKLLNRLIYAYSGFTHQRVQNRSLEIKKNNSRFHLIRITDDQALSLFPHAVQIKQDYLYLMTLASRRDHIYASLSRTYTALRYVFGESSTYFDNDKTSFCFPFLGAVEKEEVYYYILVLKDWKGRVEPKFARLWRAGDDVERQRGFFEPFEDFSIDEMCYISEYISGYLESIFDTVSEFYNEAFVKQVQSPMVLYGFQDGGFFDEFFEDPEAYERVFRRRISRLKR